MITSLWLITEETLKSRNGGLILRISATSLHGMGIWAELNGEGGGGVQTKA